MGWRVFIHGTIIDSGGEITFPKPANLKKAQYIILLEPNVPAFQF